MAKGERLLVVAEDPALGWYDGKAANAVCAWARSHGIAATILWVGGPTENLTLPALVAEPMVTHDQTVFFARLGDQCRFCDQRVRRAPVMCYVSDIAALATGYCGYDYRAFLDLKRTFDTVYRSAASIRVSCPLGSHIAGCVVGGEILPPDVCIQRFPLGIHAPVASMGFHGRIALSRFLVSTGSRDYQPSTLWLDGVVFAHIDGNHIVGFEGDARTVSRIENHYKAVADRFGIDPLFVHSWHAGIHPCCATPEGPWTDPDRWGNRVFQNPGCCISTPVAPIRRARSAGW